MHGVGRRAQGNKAQCRLHVGLLEAGPPRMDEPGCRGCPAQALLRRHHVCAGLARGLGRRVATAQRPLAANRREDLPGGDVDRIARQRSLRCLRSTVSGAMWWRRLSYFRCPAAAWHQMRALRAAVGKSAHLRGSGLPHKRGMRRDVPLGGCVRLWAVELGRGVRALRNRFLPGYGRRRQGQLRRPRVFEALGLLASRAHRCPGVLLDSANSTDPAACRGGRRGRGRRPHPHALGCLCGRLVHDHVGVPLLTRADRRRSHVVPFGQKARVDCCGVGAGRPGASRFVFPPHRRRPLCAHPTRRAAASGGSAAQRGCAACCGSGERRRLQTHPRLVGRRCVLGQRRQRLGRGRETRRRDLLFHSLPGRQHRPRILAWGGNHAPRCLERALLEPALPSPPTHDGRPRPPITRPTARFTRAGGVLPSACWAVPARLRGFGRPLRGRPRNPPGAFRQARVRPRRRGGTSLIGG
mmetsp:Transcript_48640/g.141777  ORF Transcript_48640/g.141777 Transcript_48640/m.141777 type:complete len:468 (-) Transcript_48640:37-1440(-)